MTRSISRRRVPDDQAEFICGRFTTPGIPCLNGFIGDPMIRGTLDRADKKLER